MQYIIILNSVTIMQMRLWNIIFILFFLQNIARDSLFAAL